MKTRLFPFRCHLSWVKHYSEKACEHPDLFIRSSKVLCVYIQFMLNKSKPWLRGIENVEKMYQNENKQK